MADDTPNSRGKGISQSTGLSLTKSGSNTLERSDTVKTIGRFKLRGKTDDLPQDWWFASTAIPLLAATIGPLANVLSIAALVSTWRVSLPDNGNLPLGADNYGTSIADPHWEIILNAISLGCGFFGNFCLLLNFTRRVRYIIMLPATIISWYFATGILTGIIIAMNQYVPPVRPGETYSQGFWYAVIASALYMIGSMLLMGNMLGYFLGHYPQHFDLDDDQRTLILQAMMFFFWLAGGAAVFQKVCGFTYADALYFCDVTVLTIGFGDIVATNSLGRGLVFPYSVIGIIFLGLMINSIRKFAASMSTDKVIKRHQLNERERTFGRSVTSEKELRDRLGLPPRREAPDSRRPSSARKDSLVHRRSLDAYGHFNVHGRTITFHEHNSRGGGGRGGAQRAYKPVAPKSRDAKMEQRKQQKGLGKHIKRVKRREKLIMLKEEKDRFDAMRDIQAHTNRFKQYFSLAMSIVAFGLVWCVGALIFMYAEHRIQGLTYFQALYFCYVSLLTIGYGDFSPKSNAGKPFFVVWSLIAIPTMTILISGLSGTVISAYNRGTFTLADWTVMPKEGVYRDFLEKHPKLRSFLEEWRQKREEKKRIQAGFGLQNPDEEAGAIEDDDNEPKGTALEQLAEEPAEMTDHDLARKLALSIKKVANDLRSDEPKEYTYEEWVEFTRLIRFSSKMGKPDAEVAREVEEEEEEEGLVEWDWIGEDSPMLADVSEAEWVLDRLCESLNRYTRKMARDSKKKVKPEKRFNIQETGGLNYQSSIKRQKAYHDQHIDIYPAHPGPRGQRSYTHPHKSPLHSPSDSVKEILRPETADRVEDERGESSGSGASAGDMSATTAVASPVSWDNSIVSRDWHIPFERRAESAELAREEGTRPSSRGDTLGGETPIERTVDGLS